MVKPIIGRFEGSCLEKERDQNNQKSGSNNIEIKATLPFKTPDIC